jgi:DNA-binding response OmpR family regulator
MKILIVEDNNVASMVAKIVIDNAGYKAEIAATGEQAITLSLTNTYDLILMDLGLGDADGYEVTKKIRIQSTKNKNTPIVALTAHGESEHRTKCYEAGMNDFLTKPFTMEQMAYISGKFLSKVNKLQSC